MFAWFVCDVAIEFFLEDDGRVVMDGLSAFIAGRGVCFPRGRRNQKKRKSKSPRGVFFFILGVLKVDVGLVVYFARRQFFHFLN